MRFQRTHLDVYIACAAIILSACSSDGATGPTLSGPNMIQLTSDVGDYIGGGRSYEYTGANAIINIKAVEGHLTIGVAGDEGWHSDFVMPASAKQLQKGTYQNLDGYPFQLPNAGGFDWSGEGRGCNTSRSSVTIDDVGYEADSLVALDMRFEQHCDGTVPSLRGTVHWKAGEAPPVLGPVVPIPTSLWTPSAGSVPTSGNYVYWEVPASAPVGAKFPYLMTPSNSVITVSSTGGYIGVGASGYTSFRIDFQAMVGVSPLRVGYYPGLQRYLFHNVTKGGMDVVLDSYGCNTLLGWVAIDKIAYTNGELTAIDMRFEQSCDGSPPGDGVVHWTR